MQQQTEHNDEIAFEISNDGNELETADLQEDTQNSNSQKPPKSMKKTILIISGIILLLAGFVGYMFMFQPQLAARYFSFFEKNPDLTIPATSVLINNYQSFDVQNLMSEAKLLAQISADLNPRPEPIVIRPVPRIVTRGFIQTPTWVIVTSTFTAEAQAIRTVAQNSQSGVRIGGYFWAPDYIPGAQGNFKTYIGFFDTKEDAELRIENEPAIARMFPNFTIQRLQ